MIETAAALIEAHPDALGACMCFASKANTDDFCESLALKVVTVLAARFGDRVRVLSPMRRNC